MSLGATLLLYLLIGAGVAAAAALSEGEQRLFRSVCAFFFWPLFVPLLLSGANATAEVPPPADRMADAIAESDDELQAALDSLNGWAGHVLAREQGRVQELRTVWSVQAERIREMDRLLSQPEPIPSPSNGARAASERVQQLERARRINRARLEELRMQAYDDLMGSLAWVRELASMIHLARFTGEPVARAEELVARLAEAVAELSGSWKKPGVL